MIQSGKPAVKVRKSIEAGRRKLQEVQKGWRCADFQFSAGAV